jgi:hypothetical protein
VKRKFIFDFGDSLGIFDKPWHYTQIVRNIQDDTSEAQYLDTDPQSGGSAGKIYDVDAPGHILEPQLDNSYQEKINEWAALGAPTIRANVARSVSANFPWWARTSCTQNSQGYPAFSNDVSLDNQSGPGSTPTSWNWQ